jgi:hypothetical protein
MYYLYVLYDSHDLYLCIMYEFYGVYLHVLWTICMYKLSKCHIVVFHGVSFGFLDNSIGFLQYLPENGQTGF